MSHPDERIEYYNLLVGTDSGTMYGNHQTLKCPTGTGIQDSIVINGFGYDMQEWNSHHCDIRELHEGIDICISMDKDIYAPFDCEIKSYDSDKKTVVLRKDDVQYWYDGNGGTKRDTEVTITNIKLKSGFSEGDKIKENQKFAVSTSHQYCDDDVQNAIQNYIHVKVEVDTDGVGWDFIDPRLVFY